MDKPVKDNLGNTLAIGDTVYYSYNMWKGKDVLRAGNIIKLSPTMATVQEKQTIVDGRIQEGAVNRVKLTKVGKVC